jgi:hypothetical protein
VPEFGCGRVWPACRGLRPVTVLACVSPVSMRETQVAQSHLITRLLDSWAVGCTRVGTFRTLATTSLSCAHTRVSMRSVLRTHAATVGGLASIYEAGPLPFLALGLPPVRIGRFRVCPAARPQPRLALIFLLSGLPASASDQRDSNCATSDPGGFGMSSHQITKRGCGPPLSQGEIR